MHILALDSIRHPPKLNPALRATLKKETTEISIRVSNPVANEVSPSLYGRVPATNLCDHLAGDRVVKRLMCLEGVLSQLGCDRIEETIDSLRRQRPSEVIRHH